MADRDYEVFEHGWAGMTLMALDVDEWIINDVEAIWANTSEDRPIVGVRLVSFSPSSTAGHFIAIYEREYK